MEGQTNGIIRIGNYKVDRNKVLGKGATGNVYLGFHVEKNQPIAVKAIEMSQVNNQVTKYLLEGEKKALTSIQHPYVVNAYEVLQENQFCYIFMEQCTGGTLKDYIQKKGKLDEDEAIDIFRKLVAGYISIVEALFIHRDLKPANIMIKSNGDPVIIDFGYCEMIMGKRPMIQYNVGSPSYMSPESYAKSRYSEKSDIWSLGVILYEMLTGRTLDNGLAIKQYFKQIESSGRVPIKDDKMSTLAKELLKLALAIKPQERGTIHKLKYLIDKSLIPKLPTQFRKTQSDNTPSQQRIRTETLNNVVPTQKITIKPKSTIKQPMKESKIQMNKSFLQDASLPISPKSLLKMKNQNPLNTVNNLNGGSKIFIKREGCPPAHFQMITRKKIQTSELKNLPSFPSDSRRNIYQIPTVRRVLTKPLQKKEGISLRMI